MADETPKEWESKTIANRSLRPGHVFFYACGYWELDSRESKNGGYWGEGVLLHCHEYGNPAERVTWEADRDGETTVKVRPRGRAAQR